MNSLHALKPLPRDNRDFALGNVYSLPKLEELPTSFFLPLPTVADQRGSDFCGAAASSALSEIQEGIPLSFEWVFAVAKMIEGGGSFDLTSKKLIPGTDPDSYGLNLRDVCKAHQKYGAVAWEEAPYSLDNKDPSFLRRIENWPTALFDKATKHKKESFFAVTGPYDAFDNIRASVWKFKDKKAGVLFGVIWSWSLSQVIIDSVSQTGGGHALSGFGWDDRGLYIQNSYGLDAGEHGRHYFTREVINAFAEKFGCFMFLDMPVEDARYYHDNNIKIDDNWFKALLKTFINLIIYPWKQR